LQPGKSYRVEFKANMRDKGWQEAQGSLTMVGGTGYFKDTLKGQMQRFYRVVAY